ncbi:MAG: serine hydrolase domain-containing protein, partial [Planctomycetaceae bacterium]
GTSAGPLPPVMLGRQTIADAPPLRDDAIFLIASITKPIVATAALMLVERGRLALGDRVSDVVEEFGGAGRYGITMRHLLTHTSGLPDMLPNNIELREAGSPLSAFVEGTCNAEVAFPPGRGVQYQSMGFAMLGEIIARIDGRSCRDFLREEIFRPLGMNDTELGAPDDWFAGDAPPADRIAEIRLPEHQSPDSTWHWNTRYWRSLGAPWGGLLTTPADLSRFARMMLRDGELDGVRILSPAGVRAATRNQLEPMREVPEEDRRCRPWGLGWRLNWPAHSANFGDLLGPRTFGHWGATGTVMWMDPGLDAFAVILTTQPQEPHGRTLSRVSNMIAAAWGDVCR